MIAEQINTKIPTFSQTQKTKGFVRKIEDNLILGSFLLKIA
jgi:hypothetical protein